MHTRARAEIYAYATTPHTHTNLFTYMPTHTYIYLLNTYRTRTHSIIHTTRIHHNTRARSNDAWESRMSRRSLANFAWKNTITDRLIFQSPVTRVSIRDHWCTQMRYLSAFPSTRKVDTVVGVELREWHPERTKYNGSNHILAYRLHEIRYSNKYISRSQIDHDINNMYPRTNFDL